MYQRHIIGKEGEEISIKYLCENNYQMIHRNFRCKQGEIDVIAKDLKTQELVFFEVKRRNTLSYGNPLDAVDTKKRKHLYFTIEYYIYKNHIRNCDIRFDVIEIYKNKINHIKNCELEVRG